MQKIAVAAALLVGLIFGYLGQSLIDGDPSTSNQQPTADAQEVEKLRADVASLRKQLQEHTPSIAPSAVVKSTAPKAGEAKVFSFPNPGGDKSVEFDMADMRDRMREQQEKRDEKQIAMHLATLDARLGLSGEQKAAVKELLEARAKSKRDKMGEFLNLAGKGEDAAGGEALGAVAGLLGGGEKKDSFEDELLALLGGDQRASYAEYREEKRANEIEASASRGLASLQSMFTLSEEQKDQAFDAFAKLAGEAADAKPEDGEKTSFDIGGMMKQRQARMDALKPILTPEQMEVYQDSPAVHSAVIMDIGEGIGAGNGQFFQSITIDATDSLEFVSPGNEGPE